MSDSLSNVRARIIARLSGGPATEKELLNSLSTDSTRYAYRQEIGKLLDECEIKIVSRKPAFTRDAIGYRATTYMLTKKVNFIVWLRAQVKRDDPVGDFARDYVLDSQSPREITKLRRYLNDEAGACDGAIRSFERAVEEWRNGGRSC